MRPVIKNLKTYLKFSASHGLGECDTHYERARNHDFDLQVVCAHEVTPASISIYKLNERAGLEMASPCGLFARIKLW